jgi:hypothetical protein
VADVQPQLWQQLCDSHGVQQRGRPSERLQCN